MITLKKIRQLVECFSGVSDISIKSREGLIPEYRYIYYAICRTFREELKYPSLRVITSEINRTHAMALHGLDKFDSGSLHPSTMKLYKEILTFLNSYPLESISLETVEKHEIKEFYHKKHIKISNKYREVISSLRKKLDNYRKNELVHSIASLNDEDMKELEFKLNAFFKVKNSYKKNKHEINKTKSI